MLSLLVLVISTVSPTHTSVNLDLLSEKTLAYYHFSLSQILRFEGDDQSAVQQLRKALNHDPESSNLHFSLAQSLADTAFLDESVKLCKRSIELNPDNAAPHFLLGVLYRHFFQNGRSEMLGPAIAMLARGVELEPHNVEALFNLGQLYLIRQNWKHAAQTYAQINTIRPNLPRVNLYQAQALANMGKTEEAIKAILLTSQDPAVEKDRLALLAQLYSRTERYTEAINSYKKALALTPEGENRSNLEFGMARLLIQQSLFLEAEEILEDLIKRGLTDPQLWLELGKAQEGSRHYSKAVASLQNILDQEPDNMEANYYLASSLRNLGRKEEAIDRMNKILVLSKTVSEFSSSDMQHYRGRFIQFLGVLYQETGQHQKAIDLLQRLCVDQPDNLLAKLSLLYALKDGEKLEDAKLLSLALLKAAPKDSRVIITHAKILAYLGELDKAVEFLRTELQNEPNDKSENKKSENFYLSVGQLYSRYWKYEQARNILQRGLSHYPTSQSLIFHLGSVFERLNEIEAAEKEFRKILDYNPQHAASLNYLGYMLADRELRLEEALNYIERALDQDPHNGAYLDSLGWVYFKLERLDLAEKNLGLANQVNREDSTILEHLGDLYLKLGDPALALDYYRKSVTMAENPADVKKIEEKLTALEKKSHSSRNHQEKNH